jgi:short-subunit dehydrogenase
MQLQGAVSVVTGASAGIGRATALALAGAGSDVVLAARRESKLQELARQIEKAGTRAISVACDVSSVPDIERLVAETDRAFGRVDVLVNNAGIPGGTFEDAPVERIEEVVGVNLLGAMYCARLFLPMMLSRGRGHIVNVASLAGRYAVPGAAIYGATKHGLVGFSESLYYELKPKGILVTSVNPGFVETEAFPHTDKPDWAVMKPERIAREIVEVVRNGTAPEVSIPRWLGPWQAFRVIAPPLYRYGVGRIGSRAETGTSAPRRGEGGTGGKRKG